MKKVIMVISFALFLLVPAQVSLAQEIFKEGCSASSDSTLCEEVKKNDNPLTGPNGILLKIVDILLYAIGIAAVIMIIVGGFKFVLSSGDSNNTTSARNTILYAIIGLVIAVIAKPLIGFVIRRL